MMHSPLPWRIENHYSSCATIKDANGVLITGYYDGELFEMDEDDAKLAVTAVNAHAALVAALEAIVERSRNDPLGTSKVIDMRNIALAALELARKGVIAGSLTPFHNRPLDSRQPAFFNGDIRFLIPAGQRAGGDAEQYDA